MGAPPHRQQHQQGTDRDADRERTEPVDGEADHERRQGDERVAAQPSHDPEFGADRASRNGAGATSAGTRNSRRTHDWSP